MRITIRLWATITSLIIVVLLLIWLFLIILLPKVYFEDASNRLDSHSASAELILQDEFPDDMSTQAVSSLNGLSESYGLRIELFDMAGRQLFRCGWGEGWQPLVGQEFEFLVDGNDLSKSVYHPGYGDILVAGRRVEGTPGAQSVLILCIPAAPIDDALDILAQQMLIVIAVSLAVSMIMAYYLSRMFVRPIREMDSLAASIAKGEFGRKISVRGRTELGDLADTINKMSVQLSRIETIRRDFIATVSHQFKTPLSIIQGHVELIADTLPAELGNNYVAHFSLILDEIGKLDNMAKDMLQLIRLQSIEPKRQSFSLNEMFADLASTLSVLDPEAKIKQTAEKNLLVQADPELIYRALENLLKNALTHARAQNIVMSAMQNADGRVLVSVADDGVGMTSEQIEHVWDKFYKADPNNTGNSGLGMAIVKEIFETHQVEYGIRSENGTMVWFYL